MLARRRVQPGILPVPGVRQVFAPLTARDNLQLEAFAHGSGDSLARIFMPAPALENKPRAAFGIADRGHVMETGHVVLAGSANQLLHDPQVQRACPGA